MNERFSLGKVLGTGFRVWGTNIVPFMVITALVYVPYVIWGALLVHKPTLDALNHFTVYGTALSSLLSIIASAALTFGVVMELQGQRASIGKCIAVGLVRFFPVLGVGLLTFLLVVLGFVALVIPGIIVLCMLYVATPASVIERPGVFGALGRSKSLTQNHRLEIFGVIFVMGLINWGIEKIIENSAKNGSMSFGTYIYSVIGAAIVIGSINSVMNAVAYYYLRQEKEGTSAAELAKVFE